MENEEYVYSCNSHYFGLKMDKLGGNVSKLLNYVYIYTNSDFSLEKNPKPAWENISICDDFDCLFCRHCRNKNLSIVVLSQQNFIRQKHQL